MPHKIIAYCRQMPN